MINNFSLNLSYIFIENLFHYSFLHVKPVFRFFEHDRRKSFEDAFRNFFASVNRKAMQKDNAVF
jgi:hypothetical protein